MLLFIAKYEWLLLKANRMLLLLAGITAFVLFFALFEGHRRVSFQRETLAQVSLQEKTDYARYRQQLAAANQGQHFDGGHFGDPSNPFYFGNRMGARYAVLPPRCHGYPVCRPERHVSLLLQNHAFQKAGTYHSEDPENPQVLSSGRFDVSFVIIFLLPLLVIGFTYNVYASEKEAGTLLLLMAQNVPVEKVVACRFVVRYLLFSLYFNALLLAGLALFGVSLTASFSEAATMVAITLLYTAFWFALSYWLNSFKKTSGFTATALTGAWLLAVFIVPSIISTVVDALHPLPSRLRLITQSRNISDSLAKKGNSLSRFLEEHPEFKPAAQDPKDRNATTLRTRLETEVLMEKEKAAFAAVTEKRRALVNNYRFFSPALFVQQDLNMAAGTNDEQYLGFDKQASAFQQRFRRYFEPLVYRQERFSVNLLDNVPLFLPAQKAAFRPFASTAGTDMLFLSALIAVLVLAAHQNRPGNKKQQQRNVTAKPGGVGYRKLTREGGKLTQQDL
jgi:ABC-2 type transport system permease protein